MVGIGVCFDFYLVYTVCIYLSVQTKHRCTLLIWWLFARWTFYSCQVSWSDRSNNCTHFVSFLKIGTQYLQAKMGYPKFYVAFFRPLLGNYQHSALYLDNDEEKLIFEVTGEHRACRLWTRLPKMPIWFARRVPTHSVRWCHWQKRYRHGQTGCADGVWSVTSWPMFKPESDIALSTLCSTRCITIANSLHLGD